MFRKCFVLCLILLDRFVDVELERKGGVVVVCVNQTEGKKKMPFFLVVVV